MDLFTKVVLGGVRKAAATFQPTRTEEIPRPHGGPRPDYPVEHVDIVGAGLDVPAADDDVPVRSAAARRVMKLNSLIAPFRDDPTTWRSVDECRAELRRTFGSLLPPPAVRWENPTSDAALERWALQGFGAHRLHRGAAIAGATPEEQDDLVVPMEPLRRYDVRRGLARYGGDAWFSRDGRVKRIRAGGRDVRPGDGAAWEAAKFAFRSSCLVWTTLADHVGRCHYGVANAILLATKRRLGADHGLRGFLAPFHFRTAAINHGATQSLVPKRALLHRTSGFTWESLLRIYKDAPAEYRFETFPDELRRRGVHPETIGDVHPYGSDGLAYWDRVKAFVDDALATSPALVAALGARRDETARWWDELRGSLHGGLPDLDGPVLADFLAHAIFSVTALHNHVGSVTDFVTDPTFTAGKLWPGATIADKQSTMHLCVVACITGFQMPGLAGDFGHCMPDDAARAAAGGFRRALLELDEEIAGRNARRAQPLLTFLPKRMAISVAI